MFRVGQTQVDSLIAACGQLGMTRPIASALALIAMLACAACEKPRATTPEMERFIREHTRTDHRDLEVVRAPDGSMSMDLRGRFRSVPVAYVDEQGKTRVVSSTARGAE